jgi:hypothetical protein
MSRLIEIPLHVAEGNRREGFPENVESMACPENVSSGNPFSVETWKLKYGPSDVKCTAEIRPVEFDKKTPASIVSCSRKTPSSVVSFLNGTPKSMDI